MPSKASLSVSTIRPKKAQLELARELGLSRVQATHRFDQPARAGESKYRARVGQHETIARRIRQRRAEVLGVVAVLDGLDAPGLQRRKPREQLASKRLGRRRDGVRGGDERAFEPRARASRQRVRHFVRRARGRPFVAIVEHDRRARSKSREGPEHERGKRGSAHEDDVVGPRPSQSARERRAPRRAATAPAGRGAGTPCRTRLSAGG